jgi:hypothetical protein
MVSGFNCARTAEKSQGGIPSDFHFPDISAADANRFWGHNGAFLELLKQSFMVNEKKLAMQNIKMAVVKLEYRRPPIRNTPVAFDHVATSAIILNSNNTSALRGQNILKSFGFGTI